jgi:DNA-binding NarL/FixJ family response regulator
MLLSQSLESRYVTDLARQHPRHFGYLLKDRVVDISYFTAALEQIHAGGTVMDPAVVSHLLGRSELAAQLQRLTAREREVLALMAEGRSNHSISTELVIDDKTVESHIARIFHKLDLSPAEAGHRRVLAVLAWLRA